MESAKRASALVDPKVHAQLAAPRASTRQSALESLAGLDPSVLSEHGPAIAARLDDKQKGVRLAALQALKRVPPDVLFEYAPAIMDRLEDVDNDVREAAQELLELLDSATVLPPSTALQMRRLQDTDPSVRTVAIQALAKESALLEKLAPVLVQSLAISRFHVRQGALEALAALSPHALDPYRDDVAKCLKDSHQQVRMAALRTLARLEPEDLAEVCVPPHSSSLAGPKAAAPRLIDRMTPALSRAPSAGGGRDCKADRPGRSLPLRERHNDAHKPRAGRALQVRRADLVLPLRRAARRAPGRVARRSQDAERRQRRRRRRAGRRAAEGGSTAIGRSALVERGCRCGGVERDARLRGPNYVYDSAALCQAHRSACARESAKMVMHAFKKPLPKTCPSAPRCGYHYETARGTTPGDALTSRKARCPSSCCPSSICCTRWPSP